MIILLLIILLFIILLLIILLLTILLLTTLLFLINNVNILLSDDSIDLCNYFNDSQNSRSNICNGSIEFIDDQFSPHNSSSCSSSSSNAEDSLNCTVKNERNLISLNCCGVKLRLQYPEFCELIKKK